MPPPMSLHSLALESKPIDVALSKSGASLAVLSDQGLAVYALELNKRPIPKPTLLWRSDAVKEHSPRHVTFVGDDQIFLLTDSWDEDKSHLWRSEGELLLPQGPILEDESASLLLSSVDHGSLYIYFQNGALHWVATDEVAVDLPPQTLPTHKFSSSTPEIQVVDIEGQVGAPSIPTINTYLMSVDTSLRLDEKRRAIRK
jgi:elongator complex protein 1